MFQKHLLIWEILGKQLDCFTAQFDKDFNILKYTENFLEYN